MLVVIVEWLEGLVGFGSAQRMRKVASAGVAPPLLFQGADIVQGARSGRSRLCACSCCWAEGGRAEGSGEKESEKLGDNILSNSYSKIRGKAFLEFVHQISIESTQSLHCLFTKIS